MTVPTLLPKCMAKIWPPRLLPISEQTIGVQPSSWSNRISLGYVGDANIDTPARLESKLLAKNTRYQEYQKLCWKNTVLLKQGNKFGTEDPVASYCSLLSILDSTLLNVQKVSPCKTPALAPTQVNVKVPSSWIGAAMDGRNSDFMMLLTNLVCWKHIVQL